MSLIEVIKPRGKFTMEFDQDAITTIKESLRIAKENGHLKVNFDEAMQTHALKVVGKINAALADIKPLEKVKKAPNERHESSDSTANKSDLSGSRTTS